jgi:hypothetical protein
MELRFDGPFEGRIDRTFEGWTITPDAYNRVPPKLLAFDISHGGHAHTYRQPGTEPLEPNTITPLELVR